MNPTDRTWGRPLELSGPAPVGEIETRCPGCNTRFLSGQLVMPRLAPVEGVGLVPVGFWSHIECTDRVEELEKAT